MDGYTQPLPDEKRAPSMIFRDRGSRPDPERDPDPDAQQSGPMSPGAGDMGSGPVPERINGEVVEHHRAPRSVAPLLELDESLTSAGLGDGNEDDGAGEDRGEDDRGRVDDPAVTQHRPPRVRGGASRAEPAPTVRAVVTARMMPSPRMLVEYVEASAHTDPRLGLWYPGSVWLRKRRLHGSRMLGWVLGQLLLMAAVVALMVLLPSQYLILIGVAGLLVLVGTTLALPRTAMVQGGWVRVPESLWSELVRAMVAWDGAGVEHRHIMARMDAALTDAGTLD